MLHDLRKTAEKVRTRLRLLEPLVFERTHPLPPWDYRPLPNADVLTPAALDGPWETIAPPRYWGAWRTNFLLRGSLQIPRDWDFSAPLALHLPLGDAADFFNAHPEALIYIDGEPVASADVRHQTIVLPPRWHDHAPHTLILHGWTGLGDSLHGDHRPRLYMQPCSLARLHPHLHAFLTHARAAYDTALLLDADHPTRASLLDALAAAFNRLDMREPLAEHVYASVEAAAAALAEGMAGAGAPLPVRIHAAGHAHIDTAWLWTLAQTRRKVSRTFHTVLHLMDEYPEYRFTQSQPQLYDYFRRDHPESFERLRQRVAEGRWEAIGGMWVEADCNISGAESLARQFVLGRRFYREHFGSEIDSPVLWLPDVFGFPWSLPQLAREAGMRYFFTIKLRWNEFNHIPYDSFWWEGLDGTRILTHFSTTPEAGNPHFAATYNADPTPGALLASWHKVKLKDVQRDILMSYGWGDGGGGPTRDMLDRIRALGHFPALPQVGFSSARAFFETLEAASGARLPTWSDELYLETHQGTLTTQARTKRDNRKAEGSLHDLEFLASYAAQLAPAYRYPAEALRDAWSLVCLNQFHDILPGSSIPEVYTDSRAQYAQVIEQVGALRAAAVEALAAHAGGDVVIVNPIGFSRHDLAVLPAGTLAPGAALIDPSGAPVTLQTSADGDLLIDAGQIAPYSLLALAVIDGGDAPTVVAHSDSAQAETHALENAYLRAEFDTLGDLVRVYDKVRRRDLLPPGARANFFQAFDDRPANFDAWNIDVSYEDRVWTAAPADVIAIAEEGPLRAALTIERRILGSTIRQRISLERHSPALRFDTWVDWRERHILLKVAFPVDVLAARASFDIQWGHIQRSTHRSTSWDWAKYEVALHKWMDVSEGDYGVSLVNDCKYGGDVRGSVLRLSLLRSPTFPDPDADSGAHQFSYCLLPHGGALGSDTLRAGYALNHPLLALDVRRPEGQSAPRSLPPLVRADRPNVVIETIKLAEDGDGLIVRLYDGLRQRGETLLTFAFPVESAQRTNVLEEAQHDLPVDGHTVRLTLHPFEIATLRVRRRAR